MYSIATPLTENQAFCISFSVEELTLITAAMQLPAFLGFKPPEAMPVAAAEAAARSLRLRQLAAVSDEGKFVVSNHLARLLSVCAVPDMALIVGPAFLTDAGYFRKTYDDTLIQKFHFFCAHGANLVYHNRSQPGIHSFVAMTSPDMLRVMLVTAFGLADVDTVPDGPDEVHLSIADLTMAIAELMAFGADARPEDGVSQRLPESLARALAQNPLHMVGLLWRNDWQQSGYEWTPDTRLERDGYYLVAAPEGGVWACELQGDDGETAVLRPYSGSDFVDLLVDGLHNVMGIA